MKSKSLLSVISLVIITLVLIALFSIFHFPVYNTQSNNNMLHNIMNITPLPKLIHYNLLNGSKLLTVIRNGVIENVTLGFNGFYYYVNVSFTNLRNSSIIIPTDEFFKPNTTIELFGSYPLCIEILNPLNDSAYSLLPTGIILGPIISLENYTFKPGQTMWFYKKIDYLCSISSNATFYNAFSRLSDLNPGNYELLVYSWLTNVTIKINFTITTPLVPYLVSHNGKLYAILPHEPSKIEVDDRLYSNIITVGNHIYEIGNWPNTSSGNCMELINAEIWFGNEVYNTSIYLLSYFPNEK